MGQQYSITDAFTSMPPSSSLQIATVTQPASALAVWSNGSTANTAMTSSHWQFVVTIAINAGAMPNTLYSVSVNSNTEIGSNSLGSIKFMTPSIVTPGERMTFLFDAGASIDSEAAFVVSVAK